MTVATRTPVPKTVRAVAGTPVKSKAAHKQTLAAPDDDERDFHLFDAKSIRFGAK
jgi:hypothetical protein